MFAGPDLNAPIVVGLIQSEIWAGNATVNEIIALANTLCLAIGGPLISVEVSVPLERHYSLLSIANACSAKLFWALWIKSRSGCLQD